MAVLFSKVILTSQTNEKTEFLCKGNPQSEKDLYNWAAYEEFRNIHRETEITAVVEAYLYGEGEELEATIYEVASYTQRGDRFFRNPNVQLKDRHEFKFFG